MTQTLNLTINGTARAIALDDPRATCWTCCANGSA